MLDPDLSLHWVRLSLEDLDITGDDTTTALVGLDGAIPWLCLPRFADPQRRTETFAEVELKLETWRWTGTTFRFRTGKALGHDRKEVAVRFGHVPHLPLPLPFGLNKEAAPNVLRFGPEPESMAVALTGIGTGACTLAPLTAHLPPPDLPAYGRLLLEVLHGNAALSIRVDEAEEAWRVLTPVMSAWSRDLVPLVEYPAGSAGPTPVRGS